MDIRPDSESIQTRKTQSSPVENRETSISPTTDATSPRTSSQEVISKTATPGDSHREIKVTVTKTKGNFITRFFARLFARIFGKKETPTPPQPFSQPFSSSASSLRQSIRLSEANSPRLSAKTPSSSAAQRQPPPPMPERKLASTPQPQAEVPQNSAADTPSTPAPAQRQPPPPMPEHELASPPQPQAEIPQAAPNPQPSAMLAPPPSLLTPPLTSQPRAPQHRGGAPASPASSSSMPRSAQTSGSSIPELRPAPAVIPQAFTEKLAEYREAIQSAEMGRIAEANSALSEMIRGMTEPSIQQNMISERQRITRETQLPTIVGGRKLELTVEAGNTESIQRGITVLHDYFIPKMMDCTDPQEMKQLMNDAHTLHENTRRAINQLPQESKNASFIQLANALVPESLRSRGKDYNLAATAYALKSLNKHEQLSAKTDPQLVLSVVKRKTVAEMIRIGTRPNRGTKEDADLTRGFLRDASKNAHFGEMVKSDPSIRSMVSITNEWTMIGPETTPTDPAELAKLTKDRSTLIRDFYTGAVKIERSLQLLSDVTPFLNQFLSKDQLGMLQELIEGRQQISVIRTRLEACLTSDAQVRLKDINEGMEKLNDMINHSDVDRAAFLAQLGQPGNNELPILQEAYARAREKDTNPTITNLRSELALMSVDVFTEGLDQGKALELLSDPQLATALSPITKFLQNAKQIQSTVTRLIEKEGGSTKGKKHLAAMSSSPEVQALLESAEKQSMKSNNVLILANALSNQLTTDFAGGLKNALEELLKKMPEDHPMKEQVLASYQRIQQSMQ